MFPTSVDIILITACLCAGLSGLGIAYAWQVRYQQRRQASFVQQGTHLLLNRTVIVSSGLVKQILQLMIRRSLVLKLRPDSGIFTKRKGISRAKSYQSIVNKTGLKEEISISGFLYTRACICALSFCISALFGAVISSELMVLMGLSGAILGWRIPLWALKKERDARNAEMEKHLSEMLEVITLGLRSGLSFDHAFELYYSHFSTHLSLRSAQAHNQWQLGLETREEALRALAETYNSTFLTRITESIIRSLRFGVALAETLDASALEARMVHKAHREEAVAKAPVKMLVPTATLILPAMLLLVLGPVLLEMMQGF